jgi:SanA protein
MKQRQASLQTAAGLEAAGKRRLRKSGLFWKRLLAFVLAGAVAAAGLVFFVDLAVMQIGSVKMADFSQIVQLVHSVKFDCVIVPGALVYPDGRPSEMLSDRLDMAIQLFNAGLTDRILVSGDNSRPDYNEPASMRQYLMNAGIPTECIFMDYAGFDTYDTLYRARAVFQVERALFTTQDFQLLRALYIARQLGIDVWGVKSDYKVSYRRAWYRLREYPARFKAFFDCEVLHSKPTFLGPVIPISGDGRVTLD